MLIKEHLFKNKLPLMKSALDAYAVRQKTIAKNIANENSPHYRPEEVKFEELFNNNELVLKGENSNSKHIPLGGGNPSSVEGEIADSAVPSSEVYFSGETHVNIDKEMSAMAQNQIRYRFTSQMVGKFFGGLQSAIQGQVVGK
jgi:flagellar basal-body rod protein FlgB